MRKSCRISNKGFILVTVLLISTLFLSAAVSFAWFARQEMRRAASQEFALMSRGLAVMACLEASEWIASDESESDSRHRFLYSGKSPIVMDYGDFRVSVSIEPLSGKIPINGLFLPDGTTMKNEYAYPWARIWSILEMEETAPSVLDFMDQDRAIRPGGREEDFFPNRPISDMSELLRLPGITRGRLYAGVSSDIAIDAFFTVHGGSGVNINIAPIEVISVLDPGIGDDLARRIAVFREENDIAGSEDLAQIPGFSSTSVTRLKNVINFKSDFFKVSMRVEEGTRERSFEAVLGRNGSECGIMSWRE